MSYSLFFYAWKYDVLFLKVKWYVCSFVKGDHREKLSLSSWSAAEKPSADGFNGNVLYGLHEGTDGRLLEKKQ